MDAIGQSASIPNIYDAIFCVRKREKHDIVSIFLKEQTGLIS
jgi:hypothetical protein